MLVGCHTTNIAGDAVIDVRLDRTDPHIETTTEPGPDIDAPELPADTLDDEAETCEPPSCGSIYFDLDPETRDEPREFDIPCTIISATTDDLGEMQVLLECTDDGEAVEHIIYVNTISMYLRLDFLVGERTRLSFVYVDSEWDWMADQWLVLRNSAGEIILAWLAAGQIAPPSFTGDEWYSPMSVHLATGLCPPDDVDFCGPYERAALEVEYMDERELVFDSTCTLPDDVAGLGVLVDTARQYVTVECSDHPGTEIFALFILLPES
jgi:hypothetical protein